jgi:hypothetical protein
MTEEGTLSIVRLRNNFYVRFALNNPHTMDRQLSTCTDAGHLRELLDQCGVDQWLFQRVCAELRQGRCAVLFIVVSAAQLEACFLHAIFREGGEAMPERCQL